MPTPWVDPARGAHERSPSRASKIVATTFFALMSLVGLACVATYIGTLAGSTYDELGGSIGIVFLTVFLAAVLFGWWKSFRAMRTRVRPRGVDWRSAETGTARRGRGRIGTFRRVTFGSPPPSRSRPRRTTGYYRDTAPGQQQTVARRAGTAPGISGARTQLTLSDIRAAQLLPNTERYAIAEGGRRAEVKPINKLSDIERSIGDALYRLDRTRNRHRLTRQQLAEVRIVGLEASAWLSDHAHRVDVYGHAALSDEQVADGIDRYESLARAAEDLAAGRSDLTGLTWALDRLRALVTPVPAPTGI